MVRITKSEISAFTNLARHFRDACYWLMHDHLFMRIRRRAAILCAFVLAVSAYAQPNTVPTETFSGRIIKLFGDNPAFSADAECQVVALMPHFTPNFPEKITTTFPEKISFDHGKSRLQVNISEVKGNPVTAAVAGQMKTMGADTTVTISRPDLKTIYGIYPGLSAYDVTQMQDPDDAKPASAFKIATTELGKESVEGHPCVKNKAVVTNDQGKSQEFTTWNATDLNKFPVKIEMVHQGGSGPRSYTNVVTMLFRNVKLSKPDTALFDPPAGYKRYNSNGEMMEELMKRMGSTQQQHP